MLTGGEKFSFFPELPLTGSGRERRSHIYRMGPELWEAPARRGRHSIHSYCFQYIRIVFNRESIQGHGPTIAEPCIPYCGGGGGGVGGWGGGGPPPINQKLGLGVGTITSSIPLWPYGPFINNPKALYSNRPLYCPPTHVPFSAGTTSQIFPIPSPALTCTPRDLNLIGEFSGIGMRGLGFEGSQRFQRSWTSLGGGG